MNKNNIEKPEKDLKEFKQLLAKRTQLELPFEKPETADIIEFKPKPGSPILEWWKTHKDETKNLMNETEIESVLQDLLEKGVL
jgi:hypothetical protein